MYPVLNISYMYFTRIWKILVVFHKVIKKNLHVIIDHFYVIVLYFTFSVIEWEDAQTPHLADYAISPPHFHHCLMVHPVNMRYIRGRGQGIGMTRNS